MRPTFMCPSIPSRADATWRRRHTSSKPSLSQHRRRAGRLCRALESFQVSYRRGPTKAGESFWYTWMRLRADSHTKMRSSSSTHTPVGPQKSFSVPYRRRAAARPHLRIGVQLFLAPLGDGCIAGPRRDKIALGIEDLQPVVQPVSHVDDPIAIHRNTGGTIEFTLSRARPAALHQKLTIRAELLNTVIAPVGNVHIALHCRGRCPRAY